MSVCVCTHTCTLTHTHTPACMLMLEHAHLYLLMWIPCLILNLWLFSGTILERPHSPIKFWLAPWERKKRKFCFRNYFLYVSNGKLCDLCVYYKPFSFILLFSNKQKKKNQIKATKKKNIKQILKQVNERNEITFLWRYMHFYVHSNITYNS